MRAGLDRARQLLGELGVERSFRCGVANPSPECVKCRIMEIRITATELARKLRGVLGGIRYRFDSFVVERNGEAIARISPVAGNTAGSLGEGLRAWREAAPADPRFGDDLESVNRADRPPRNPWAS
jgi:hypothetical protein